MDTGHGALALPSFDDRPILRDRVARELRAALIAGEMRPGVVYSAPALAAQFGVSPTPVREAMLDLANEGLVEAVRNKGFRVTELSDRELDEFTEVRALIEVPVVARLAGVVTPAQTAALRPVAEEIVAAAEAGDLIRYVEADRRFHLSLLALAGNEHLVRVVGDLRKRSRLYGLSRLARGGRLAASAAEHLELLDALDSGDPAAAEQVMARHIGHVRNLWAGPEREG
ncbi:GntR family transcriptional regulator [Embleya sp. NPDC055664]|uniref:GntR family transcriptional regulator n=1 Tax=Embleya scabrispora TaxID=159449 RepID=A0A1T3P472_9ACTN|nr:GntR family transcriptional regulator [Embleya scabrispora]OPC83761.1 GntR family transcriptional regulator [Embleya scabrispora]